MNGQRLVPPPLVRTKERRTVWCVFRTDRTADPGRADVEGLAVPKHPKHGSWTTSEDWLFQGKTREEAEAALARNKPKNDYQWLYSVQEVPAN